MLLLSTSGLKKPLGSRQAGVREGCTYATGIPNKRGGYCTGMRSNRHRVRLDVAGNAAAQVCCCSLFVYPTCIILLAVPRICEDV